MPIYGYRCEKCGHEIEVLQRMSDAPPKTCQKCKGKLSKMMYAAGVVFKGSGYYTTDYKDAGKGSSNGTTEGTESGSETKPEAKPESKSEAKTESTTESKAESKKESKPKSGEKKAS
jgi:putative FmdB family regulatory protein